MVTRKFKISGRPTHARQRALLITEVVVAMGILVVAVLPLGYLYLKDARLFRMSYQRAVAVEMVDGEMEILAAGEWQTYPEGTNAYAARVASAGQLPPGRFLFIRSGKHLRLEWAPEPRRTGIGHVIREVTLR